MGYHDKTMNKNIKHLNLFDVGFKTLFRVLTWMLSVSKLKEPVDLSTVRPLIAKMDRIFNTRGRAQFVLWCKNHRLALLHFLSGEYPNKVVEGVSYTKDGFPKGLGVPKELLVSSITLKRLVLTILYSSRALNLGTTPDIQPIISPSLVTDPVIGGNPSEFWRSIGCRPSKEGIPRRLRFKNFHFTTKAGPNKPGTALYSSMRDFMALQGTPTLDAIKTLGGPKLARVFEILSLSAHLIPGTGWTKGNSLRRLTWFGDSEFKVRVVAILDYWSQTALRPLHDYLFSILKRIPQDCTFSQGKFKEAAKTWKFYDSVDLSSATDRFPIQVISFVLKGLLPEWYVQAWEKVMVGLPFDFRTGGEKIESLFYRVGNPMGAYSSWASFTISHHYIMWWCCRQLGLSWENAPYLILGDDVLIGDQSLSLKYRETIASLGVSISDVKSHTSSKLFEFAKRLVLDGEEISPFPLSAIGQVSKRFYLLTNFLMEQENRGWVWESGIPGSVSEFYRTVLRRNAVYCKKTEGRSLLSELMMKVMRGSIPANDAVKSIIGWYKIPVSVKNSLELMSAEHAQSIIAEAAQTCFLKSDPFDSRGGVRSEPLGEFATNLTIAITSLYDVPELVEVVPDIPSSIPILNVYGQFSEEYIKVRKDVYSFGEPDKLDWPMRLRSLALPTSDKVFTERATHTISRVAAVFGDAVKQNLERLTELEIWFFSRKN